MKTIRKAQHGFSLLTAIFLLVVIAALAAFAVTISTTQQRGIALDVLGARAYQASRVGIDWGAYQLLRNGGGCGAASAALPAGTLGGTLGGFTVNVGCTATAHSEAAAITMYQLTSTATLGAVAAPDYVERQMTATIAQ